MALQNARGVRAVAGGVLVPAIVIGLTSSIYALLLLPWRAEFGIARSVAMGSFTAMTLVAALTAPVVGWLIVRFDPRIVVVTGLCLIGGGLLTAAGAASFWLIAVAYGVLIATGSAMAGHIPARTVALRHFPNYAGALSGVITVGMALLSAIAPIIAALVIAEHGWRVMLTVAAVFLVAVGTPAAWLLMVLPKHGAKQDEIRTAAANYSAMSAFRNLSFWLIIAAELPIGIAGVAVVPHLVAMAADGGIGLVQGGYLVSSLAVGSAVGSPLFGWLADRFDMRVLYAGLVALVAGGALTMMNQTQFSVFVAATVPFGMACGAGMPLLSVLVVRYFGVAVFPRVVGLAAPFTLPATFAAVVSGAVRDATGSYSLVFIGATALMGGGMLAILLLTRRPRFAPGASQF